MADKPLSPKSDSSDCRYDANKDEVEIIWKCLRCGELMPRTASLADTCPACGAPKTEFVLLDED